jgi:hypothetical protein
MNEIIRQLEEWRDSGAMRSKLDVLDRGSKFPYASMNKALAEGTFFRSSVEGILFMDVQARDEFERLYDERKILTYNRLAIKLGDKGVTQHSVNMAVTKKRVLRFDMGKAAILYVINSEEGVSDERRGQE